MLNKFLFKIILPSLIMLLLFCIMIFLTIIPEIKSLILNEKKEMIRELTRSAWNILSKYHYDVENGLLSEEEAKKLSISQIQNLHYGREMAEYFWINDFEPRMIIHPYRHDLDGKDLSKISDPNGKNIFIEFVKIAQNNRSGFVEYLWQWHDDTTKIIPKLSYVKAFEPWEWIIGTGIYIDDIQWEIDQVTNKIIWESLVILLVVAIIMGYIFRENYKSETQKKNIEIALTKSEEKYRTLVESAGESIIMSLENEKLFANTSLLNKLGYTAEEFSKLKISDILEQNEEEQQLGYPFYAGLLEHKEVPEKYKTYLKTKNQGHFEALISLSRINIQNKTGFIAIISDITMEKEKEIEQDRIIGELQSAFQYYNREIGDQFQQDIQFVYEDQKIGEYLNQYIETNSGQDPVIFIRNHAENLIGYSTYKKLMIKQLQSKKSETEFKEIAEPITFKVSTDSLLLEAYLKLKQHPDKILALENQDNEISGAIRLSSFTRIEEYSPTILIREIENAKTPRQIIEINKRLPIISKILAQNGINPSYIYQYISLNSDTILKKFLQFAYQIIGPPPIDFVFMIMGSEGRKEQTLKTDQDNAIIYENPEPKDSGTVNEYFLRLGNLICDWLNEAGFSYCEGGVMAKNPLWVQPVDIWKQKFYSWVTTMEAEDLLNTKIFFDFRGIQRHPLIEQLKEYLNQTLQNNPRFFTLLARNILLLEPPVNLFGGIATEEIHPNKKVLDIKSAMTPIVDFARIYALKNNISETNTIARLKALRKIKIITQQNYDEMFQSYSFLMRLRIENQVNAINNNQLPDNYIDPKTITLIERKILKEIFGQMKNFQVRLSYDFTGMMHQI